MAVLNFTLMPDAAAKLHDLLVCLGKFSDTVAIEARRDRVGFNPLEVTRFS
jgi:cell cycle checkpoint control protein RAD9A